MSDFYLVQPAALTPATLISTTAPETTPMWASGTSYAISVVVRHPAADGLTHKWQSLIAANATTPGADATKWADLGADNRHAMLDAYNSSQSTAASPLVVELQPGAIVTTVALFNLTGNSVRVEMIDSAGVTIFDETKSLSKRLTSSWSEYYFLGFAGRLTQAIFTGLPFSLSAKLRITVSGTGTVGIGRIVAGRKQVIGCVSLGISPFLTDYSRKQWDADFGDYTWQVRDYSRGFRGSALLDNGQLNRVWSTLISVRAVPTLWVASEDERYSETLITLGVLQDAPASIDYPNHTMLNFTIEGLT